MDNMEASVIQAFNALTNNAGLPEVLDDVDGPSSTLVICAQVPSCCRSCATGREPRRGTPRVIGSAAVRAPLRPERRVCCQLNGRLDQRCVFRAGQLPAAVTLARDHAIRWRSICLGAAALDSSEAYLEPALFRIHFDRDADTRECVALLRASRPRRNPWSYSRRLLARWQTGMKASASHTAPQL